MKLNLGIALIALLSSANALAGPKLDMSGWSCEKHQDFSEKMNGFATEFFVKKYNKPEQVDAATAQLMLIEMKGPGQFSQIYNEDEMNFKQNSDSATAKGCNVSAYPRSPIGEFKFQLERLKQSAGKI